MGAGTVFLLLLVVIVLAVAAFLLFGGSLASSGRRSERDERATSDDPEANARFERGERPEHTRVEDPAKQTYVDG
jgi:hypothetical protein